MRKLNRPSLARRIITAILQRESLDLIHNPRRHSRQPLERNREISRNSAINQLSFRQTPLLLNSSLYGISCNPLLALINNPANLTVKARPELHHRSNKRFMLSGRSLVCTTTTLARNNNPRNKTHHAKPSLVAGTRQKELANGGIKLEFGFARGTHSRKNTSKANKPEVLHDLNQISLDSQSHIERQHEVNNLGNQATVFARDIKLIIGGALACPLHLLQQDISECAPHRLDSHGKALRCNIQRVNRCHCEVRRNRLRKQVRILLSADRANSTLPRGRIRQRQIAARAMTNIIA